MLESLRDLPSNVIGLRAKGRVTLDEAIFVPQLAWAAAGHAQATTGAAVLA
ncbi:MAG: hypothetical protein AAGF12_26745 [Myxococcota bacterium]